MTEPPEDDEDEIGYSAQAQILLGGYGGIGLPFAPAMSPYDQLPLPSGLTYSVPAGGLALQFVVEGTIFT